MANPNYVKFQRGSIAQYNRLAVKDPNTLYFIYNHKFFNAQINCLTSLNHFFS